MSNLYTVRAWWPNVIEEPHTRYVAHLADALDICVNLAYSGKHTTITCTTPDSLEVFRFWGQLKDLP